MAYQSFSPKMQLAKAIVKAIVKAKAAGPLAASQAQKDRCKAVAQVRDAKRLAENLTQRALIESKRSAR